MSNRTFTADRADWTPTIACSQADRLQSERWKKSYDIPNAYYEMGHSDSPIPKITILGAKRKIGDFSQVTSALESWRQLVEEQHETLRRVAEAATWGVFGKKNRFAWGGTPNHIGKPSENHRKTIGKSQSEKRCQWMVYGCSVEFRIPKYGWL